MYVLSIVLLIGLFEIFKDVGIECLCEKFLYIMRYMLNLIGYELKDFEFIIGNLLEDEKWGGYIYLEYVEVVCICKVLKVNGVILDFRVLNGVRFVLVVLYNIYEEVWKFV